MRCNAVIIVRRWTCLEIPPTFRRHCSICVGRIITASLFVFLKEKRVLSAGVCADECRRTFTLYFAICAWTLLRFSAEKLVFCFSWTKLIYFKDRSFLKYVSKRICWEKDLSWFRKRNLLFENFLRIEWRLHGMRKSRGRRLSRVWSFCDEEIDCGEWTGFPCVLCSFFLQFVCLLFFMTHFDHLNTWTFHLLSLLVRP